MSLEHAGITWSAKQLSNMIKNKKVDFDHIVQRSYVWEKSRKSALIESMMVGYDIPKVYAKRTDDGSGKRGGNIYSILDGKQRLSTVKQFLNDEFALTELPPVTYLDETLGEKQTVDVSGKRFSELPEGLRDLLQAITFSVVYYDNLTPDEERELFKRLNAGKPLSVKSRVLASCQNIGELLDIGSHELFSEMLTQRAIENKNQVTLVMKSWCMLFMDISEVSFESAVFHPLLESKAHISDEESYILATVFDFAMDVHKILKERRQTKLAAKMYKETHLISLIPYIKKASDLGIKEALFADWVQAFFGTLDKTSVSDVYNEAASNGVSKTAAIVLRDTALMESFYDFFGHEEVSDASGPQVAASGNAVDHPPRNLKKTDAPSEDIPKTRETDSLQEGICEASQNTAPENNADEDELEAQGLSA